MKKTPHYGKMDCKIGSVSIDIIERSPGASVGPPGHHPQQRIRNLRRMAHALTFRHRPGQHTEVDARSFNHGQISKTLFQALTYNRHHAFRIITWHGSPTALLSVRLDLTRQRIRNLRRMAHALTFKHRPVSTQRSTPDRSTTGKYQSQYSGACNAPKAGSASPMNETD